MVSEEEGGEPEPEPGACPLREGKTSLGHGHRPGPLYRMSELCCGLLGGEQPDVGEPGGSGYGESNPVVEDLSRNEGGGLSCKTAIDSPALPAV